MYNLSKTILIISIAVISASALGVSCVQAQANETNHIKVEVWNGTIYEDLCSDEECLNSIALFNEANFLPGDDTIIRTVRITNRDITGNNTGVAQKIGIAAIHIINPDVNTAGDKFGDVLYLEIKEGTNMRYESSLTTFFGAGDVTISDPVLPLANNAFAIYDFSVKFNPDAGNDYQSASLDFALDFGLQGTETGPTPPPIYQCNDGLDNDGDGKTDYPDDPGCDSLTDNDETDGGGAGGGGIPLGLTIQYENSQVATTTATITWLTSYRSTSRVIYRTKFGDGFDLYAGEPNYGYQSYTDEFDNDIPINSSEKGHGVTGHSITIYNLSSGTTYWFRCVSHASPDTIGTEHSFTTLAVGDTGAEGDAGDGDGTGDGAGDGDIGDGDTGAGAGAGDGDTGGAGDTGDTGGDTSGTGDTGDTGDEGDTGAEGDDEFEYGDHIYEHQEDQGDDELSLIDDQLGDDSDDDSKFLASIAAFFGDLEGWRLALMFLLWIILALIILRLIKAWIDRNKQK